MATIQDLESADLRVIRGDDGRITSIVDTWGRDVGLVSSKYNSVTGGIESLTAGGQVISPYASFTWVGKPAVAAWPVGVPIIVTDVGGSAGSQWVTDGVSWKPANGSVLLGARSGSVAAPVATITGAASGKFTLPFDIRIPAGALIAGVTQLEIVATMRRRGVAATNQFIVYVGSTNSTSDSVSMAVMGTATNNQDCTVFPVIGFPAAGTMTTSTWNGVASTTGAADNTDRTTNINTAANMFVNFGVFGGNVADSYDLIAYRASLVG